MDIVVSNWAWIPLASFDPERLDRLRSRLTIQPKRTSVHQEVILPIHLYRERRTEIGIPREFFFGNRNLNHTVIDKMSRGRPIDLKFSGILTPDQERAVAAATSGGVSGIIQAAPGWGKTVVGLACWVRIATTAIVVVQKEYLVHQWIERVRTFVPDARIGIIQQNSCQFGDEYDIAIATIQSLESRRKEYPEELWSWPGLVIPDEVHRVAAHTWSDVVPLFTAARRLGLSATPKRKDGADNVFFWHIGPVLYKSKVRRVVPKLRRVFTKYEFRVTPKFNPNEYSKEIQLRLVCGNPERNRLIVAELLEATKAGRKVMVLSERRKHLETLREMFGQVKSQNCTCDFYVGNRTMDELKLAEKADVLFCTYQMTKEALDIPRLDTVFLTTPVADVEQAVGRIMREHPDKKQPVVVDFIDNRIKRFAKLWTSRLRFYRREGMFVEMEAK